jgi:hypothetical protein
VECDGPEDCASGNICCGEQGGITDSVFSRVYCRKDCVGGITTARSEICHPGGAACTNGKACGADSYAPPGYHDCG